MADQLDAVQEVLLLMVREQASVQGADLDGLLEWLLTCDGMEAASQVIGSVLDKYVNRNSAIQTDLS